MYAIIETGGKQYRVQEGDVITVEKLDVAAGEAIELDKVLVLNDDKELKVGAPYIEGAKVFGEVVESGKGQKVVIYKYKSKKDYHKKQGHRQPYTTIEIKSLNGEAPANAEKSAKVSSSMLKDELIAFAEEHNVEIDPKATKAVIIETINAAL